MKFGNTKIGGMSFGPTKIGGAKYGNTLVFQSGEGGGGEGDVIILPDGYTKVEYVENSFKTNYILTDYYCNNNTRLVIEFSNVGKTRNDWNFLFGARKTTNNVEDFSFAIFTDSTAPRENFGNNEVYYATDLLLGKHFVVDKNKDKTTITDLSTSTIIAEHSFTPNTFNTTPKLTLLQQNRASNKTAITSAGQAAMGKLYDVKIYDDGVLSRHYIPCKNPQDLAGLYDVVNGLFITGNKTLTAGPTI